MNTYEGAVEVSGIDRILDGVEGVSAFLLDVKAGNEHLSDEDAKRMAIDALKKLISDNEYPTGEVIQLPTTEEIDEAV